MGKRGQTQAQPFGYLSSVDPMDVRVMGVFSSVRPI
jgi:hypothetical protein